MSRVTGGSTTSTTSSLLKPLFHKDESVLGFIGVLDQAAGKLVESNNCGGICMKAGTDSKKPHADKYYTGREFGTCKHVIAKAGANFVRTGERYGYAFYLQVMEFGEGLQFLHLDINCLHTHWRKLAVAAVQNSTDQIVLNHPARAAILQHHRESANLIPLVSEMHVKTHDFACQILFSPAFCPEADKSTGEEGELFHTSASKWTNTRQMGESASVEEITDNTMFHNRIKVDKQAKALRMRHDNTSKSMAKDQEQLTQRIDELQSIYPNLDITFGKAYADLRAVGQGIFENRRTSKKDDHGVEFLKLRLRIKDAEALEGFIQSLTALELLLGLSAAGAPSEQQEDSMQRAAADTAMEKMQDMMEGHSRNCGQYQHIVDTAGKAGKKERDRYTKKIGKVKSTLSKLIQRYAEVNSVLPKDHPYCMQGELKMDDLISVDSFPWTDARAAIHLQGNTKNLVKVIGVRACMQYVEAHIKVKRNANELKNLQQETAHYIAYYKGKRENTLEALRQITLDEQARVVDDVPMTSGKSSDLNENFNTRYIATTAVKAATPSFHSGFSAVLKRSMSFFDLQIRRAHDSW
eukprot:CAMPEP_0198202804 /NCGR_PEP_ID=MMETSP1445-20131203/6024_1 /TAXON_ID=36898 /ORGANISM="Pyramimonas sp., Strain CCMP2087" /LENGTH=579 /DNA_ID=CAMNT_0043873909 /DNA_START=1852 /DNA_END=3587 /DNA_ORIENTATION=+